MNQKLLFCMLLLVVATHSYAQYGTERIEMKQGWSGYSFTVDEKKVSLSKALEMIQLVDTAAYAKMQKSRTNKNWAATLGFLGGLAIGYPLGETLVGAKPKWELGLLGAVLAGISIPVNNKARHQATDALELYNSKVTSSPHRHKPSINLVYNRNGLGVRVAF